MYFAADILKYMKQLIDHIQKSIYGPLYYQELLGRSLGFSWKYYSGLSLLLALFMTVVLSIPLVPKVLEATHSFPSAFFAYFPDELEIRVDKGIVSTNVAEPYIFQIPPRLKEEMLEDDPFQSLAVIDTVTPFSMEQWKAYKTIAWLGKSEIAIMDDGGGVRVESFGPEWNFTVNESVLRRGEERLQPFYKIAAPVIVLAIFLGFLVALGVNFLYLIFGAAFIFILGRLLKQRWSYGTSYRLGLHAITLPVLFETLLFATGFKALQFPFLFSAVTLLVVFMNFRGVAPTTTPLTPTV